MASVYVFRFVQFFHFVLVLSAVYGNGKHDDECPPSFDCGNLGSLHFPFTKHEQKHCGLFAVRGCDGPSLNKTIQLQKNGRILQLTNVVQQEKLIITVFDPDRHRTCDVASNSNMLLPQNSPLASFRFKHNVASLFRCRHYPHIRPPPGFINHTCPDFDVFCHDLSPHTPPPGPPNLDQMQTYLPDCSVLPLPCKNLTYASDFSSFLCGEVDIEVHASGDCDECYNHKGGQCQVDDHNTFYCDVGPIGNRKSLVIPATVVAATILGVFVLIMYWLKSTLFLDKITTFWKNKSKTHQEFEALFLKSHGSLATKRYSYSKIKKMTSCFKEKLGQGGYGTVFKGQLHDQCPVAVKVLNETKGNGEEFINEVASISKTSHVNIVTLLGFCFEGSKKALVYEFMANGSLEKFIFENKENLLDVNLQLSCEILHQIAVGVARGLEYLHRGCNTRILHFDIKPHNILLDENFCPKISDFGLAKICPRNESFISMTGARGTIGYIAPEVISRNFGVVSHKSDVYSFGMMILEMVGGRRNVNVNVDNSSEIYFPHWIYKRLELNEELALRSIRNEGDIESIRQMVITSLWCIQTNPLDRPVMSKVVEMLEGRVETLQIPPKPYLSSPSTSPRSSSSLTH